MNRKKNVLVTGASRGIGAACARSFALCGYHVYMNSYHSPEDLFALAKELSHSGGSCHPLPGDMGNAKDVDAMFAEMGSTFGEPDILINNAGTFHIGLLSDMSNAQWDTLLQTNLSSVFYACRRAIPHMVAQQAGKIINISSMWGRVGASCEAAYSATKAGVDGLTMALAKELAPSNIQVNAIACGVIDTNMNRGLSAQERKALQDQIPAGRFGTPEEVASLVLQLTESPVYLTGQIIGLDGGFI